MTTFCSQLTLFAAPGVRILSSAGDVAGALLSADADIGEHDGGEVTRLVRVQRHGLARVVHPMQAAIAELFGSLSVVGSSFKRLLLGHDVPVGPARAPGLRDGLEVSRELEVFARLPALPPGLPPRARLNTVPFLPQLLPALALGIAGSGAARHLGADYGLYVVQESEFRELGTIALDISSPLLLIVYRVLVRYLRLLFHGPLATASHRYGDCLSLTARVQLWLFFFGWGSIWKTSFCRVFRLAGRAEAGVAGRGAVSAVAMHITLTSSPFDHRVPAEPLYYRTQQGIMTTSDDGEFDPFSELGVRPGATYDEIRKAYRRQVLVAHPDRKNGAVGAAAAASAATSSSTASTTTSSEAGTSNVIAATRFHRIQRAWEILRVRAEREGRSSALAAAELSAYKQDATDELDLEEDMEWDGERECFFFVEGCRCGGAVEVTSAQLDEDAADGRSAVVCSGCSLEYSVVFGVDEEWEEGEEGEEGEQATRETATVEETGERIDGDAIGATENA